jgi:hypothetical protein
MSENLVSFDEFKRRMEAVKQSFPIITKVVDGKTIELVNIDELSPHQRALFFDTQQSAPDRSPEGWPSAEQWLTGEIGAGKARSRLEEITAIINSLLYAKEQISFSNYDCGNIDKVLRLLALLSAAPAAPASGAVHRIEELIAACKKDASKHWENIPRRDAALMKAACYEVARDEVLAAAPASGAEQMLTVERLMKGTAAQVAAYFVPDVVTSHAGCTRREFTTEQPPKQRLLAELLARLAPSPSPPGWKEAREALIAAREYIKNHTDIVNAGPVLKQIEAVLAGKGSNKEE